MGVTNKESGTRIDEIADGIYRISTPVSEVPGGFSFNQYLIKDEQPLLYHTGPRGIFTLVAEAITSVLPVEKLRFIGFSHYESDECGSLNQFLARARDAAPLCGKVNAIINGDSFDRPARALEDGEVQSIGRHEIRWIATPHLPHSWECGHLMEEKTRTLLCGDLFTQGGSDQPPLTGADILGPSEAFRKAMDYYSNTKDIRSLMGKLTECKPATLACMHGSAWHGDGARILLALTDALDAPRT